VVEGTIDLAERFSPQAPDRGLKLADVVTSAAEPAATGPAFAPSGKSKLASDGPSPPVRIPPPAASLAPVRPPTTDRRRE
jgi:hypothetical protein